MTEVVRVVERCWSGAEERVVEDPQADPLTIVSREYSHVHTDDDDDDDDFFENKTLKKKKGLQSMQKL